MVAWNEMKRMQDSRAAGNKSTVVFLWVLPALRLSIHPDFPRTVVDRRVCCQLPPPFISCAPILFRPCAQRPPSAGGLLAAAFGCGSERSIRLTGSLEAWDWEWLKPCPFWRNSSLTFEFSRNGSHCSFNSIFSRIRLYFLSGCSSILSKSSGFQREAVDVVSGVASSMLLAAIFRSTIIYLLKLRGIGKCAVGTVQTSCMSFFWRNGIL